jgi:hypothetical protein
MRGVHCAAPRTLTDMAADVYFGHRGRSPQCVDRASTFRYDDSITSAKMSILMTWMPCAE